MSYNINNWIAYYNNARKRQEQSLANSYEKDLIEDLRCFVSNMRLSLCKAYRMYKRMTSIRYFKKYYGNISPNNLDDYLYKCKILILTANPIEKAILHYFAINNGNKKIHKIIYDEESYFIFKINKYYVCHLAQSQTGSYKDYGTYTTVQKALKHFTPNVIFALGVAFGIDYKTQHIGDVLVSKRLLPYSVNKRIDDKIKPDRNQDKKIDNWLEVRLNSLPGFMDKVTYGDILSGDSVMSSVDEKDKICLAYSENEFIIGGEMEGNALFQISNSTDIPCVIIKGICDWGVAKNNLYDNSKKEEHTKISLQAYAMLNVLEKCRILFCDASLFDIPKYNEIKKLNTSIKKNILNYVLLIITIVSNIFIDIGYHDLIIKPIFLKDILYLCYILLVLIINSNIIAQILKRKKLLKFSKIEKENNM